HPDDAAVARGGHRGGSRGRGAPRSAARRRGRGDRRRGMTTALEEARDWAARDPDDETRAELEATIAAAEAGDQVAQAEVADAFSGRLQFGTAGLRGRMGPG